MWSCPIRHPIKGVRLTLSSQREKISSRELKKMAKFFALSILLQSCFVVQAQQYGNNVPAIQKQMLAAMDTCIEYMTAALICHPPKRKLEKVFFRVIRTLDDKNNCIFSTTTDLEAFSSMLFTIKLLENVKIVVDDNLQHAIVVT